MTIDLAAAFGVIGLTVSMIFTLGVFIYIGESVTSNDEDCQ